MFGFLNITKRNSFSNVLNSLNFRSIQISFAAGSLKSAHNPLILRETFAQIRSVSLSIRSISLKVRSKKNPLEIRSLKVKRQLMLGFLNITKEIPFQTY